MKIIYCIILTLFIGHQVLAQWEIVDESDCAYNSVFFLNDSVGFVVGICGGNNITIKKTTNYGESWYIVHDTINAWIYDIYFPSDSVGYASTYENVLKTTDGGESWFYPTPEFEGYPYRSIVFQDNTIGFGCFADGSAAFAKTIDGGYTWIEDYTYGGREILMSADCEIHIISGQYGKSDNCWESYETTFADVGQRTISNFAYANASLMLACGQGITEDTWQNFGFIVKSISDGESWMIQDFENIYALRSIVNVSSDTFYCLGQPYSPYAYSFLKTVDGGESWNFQEYEFACMTCYTPDMRDVYCPSENVCYAVSGGGGIWRTLNGGGELFPMPVNVTEFEANDVSISPNPATNSIAISSETEMTEIQIFNSFGQLVHKEKVSGKSKNINIAELGQGIYIIAIKSDIGVSNQRFVKQ